MSHDAFVQALRNLCQEAGVRLVTSEYDDDGTQVDTFWAFQHTTAEWEVVLNDSLAALINPEL